LSTQVVVVGVYCHNEVFVHMAQCLKVCIQILLQKLLQNSPRNPNAWNVRSPTAKSNIIILVYPGASQKVRLGDLEVNCGIGRDADSVGENGGDCGGPRGGASPLVTDLPEDGGTKGPVQAGIEAVRDTGVWVFYGARRHAL
jgi:hypothetical protein